jgi:TRAP-type C4-dicarboxylate transport system substrate-binding protein
MGWTAVLTLSMALTACAESETPGSEGGSESGEGVAFGASMEEYHEAFADVDPIKLNTQTPGPKGSGSGHRMEEYLKAVEEWSDGKITFEVGYSNALAPPEEIDNAVIDGRLDLGLALPVYEPSEYPANVALNDASFVGRQTPLVGVMAGHAWMVEVAYDTPAMAEEIEATGAHVLVPAFNSGHSMMICAEERTALADFKGQEILSGGTTQGHQISGLGGTPLSVPYTEVFESLQRGIAACTVSSLLGVDLGGYAAVANKVTTSPDAGYAITTGNMIINQEIWDSLPLVARQLMFDRLDSFYRGSVEGTWTATAQAVGAILGEGGSFHPYADDAAKALQSANDELLGAAAENDATGDGQAFVDRVTDSSERWTTLVGELGYEDVEDFEAFADLINNDPPDLQPYIDALYEEVLLEHRPS